MEYLTAVYDYFFEVGMVRGGERILLWSAILDIVVAWTPWKGDDDLLKIVKKSALQILKRKTGV